jgi:hypothetical protein
MSSYKIYRSRSACIFMVILLYILPLCKMDVCCDRCNIYLFSLVVLPPFRFKGPTRIVRLLIWLIKFKLYSIKIIPLETKRSKVFNDIFFVIYTLYYVVQISNLGIRIGPLNQNQGSNLFCYFSLHVLEKNIQVTSLIFVADVLPIYFCYLGISTIGEVRFEWAQ